ncbi:flagellar basal-body MS-ring/collar protein FliF [Haliovirga abyssi]|uniref:Flagellar M-ring protein n=1 Tax=Haliovirga abyssi TaxID=2996794 RepID=A0AAU9DTI5_9FUSO|nr:flagellar basal-body MS-ring/collar protein FliF [Haliovirga abyssi]BDU50484.1 flagellar M-ring protein [Haliovirga abyssi]
MDETIKKIIEKAKSIWEGLSKIKKILIIVSIVATMIFTILFSMASSRTNYEPLFTELTAKDASLIKADLDKKGVKYKISQGGTAIEVDSKEKYSLRLDLAKDGVVPTGGTVGFEIFDKAKIGSTDFDKKMMFLRAQKGELERTIAALSQVKKAVVNITPAEDSPFAEDRVSAKASILVQLQPLGKLTEENVKGIMLLAVSSVEGLTIDNVEVIDSNGNILSDNITINKNSSEFNDKKLQLQNKMEKELERKVTGLLSVLGAGNYRVKVAVSLDFDKQLTNKEEYTTPTISGEQSTQGLVRSKQENNEIYKGTGDGNASGVPGTSSNIPGYVATDSSKNGKEYSKNNNTVNYELNKTNSQYEKSLGSIKKLNVSVVLNENSDYFKKTKFNDNERTKFQNMVKAAINFDDNRGDKINIDVIPFDTKTIDKFQHVIETQQKYQKYIVIGVIASIILIIALVIIYFVMKKAEEKRLREKERRAVEELIPEMEEVALGEQLTVEEQERKEKEEQIKNIAKQKPEEVAGLIRTWLLQD